MAGKAADATFSHKKQTDPKRFRLLFLRENAPQRGKGVKPAGSGLCGVIPSSRAGNLSQRRNSFAPAEAWRGADCRVESAARTPRNLNNPKTMGRSGTASRMPQLVAAFQRLDRGVLPRRIGSADTAPPLKSGECASRGATRLRQPKLGAGQTAASNWQRGHRAARQLRLSSQSSSASLGGKNSLTGNLIRRKSSQGSSVLPQEPAVHSLSGRQKS